MYGMFWGPREPSRTHLSMRVGLRNMQSMGLYLSCSLNTLKGYTWGIIQRSSIRLIKGDTRSLDNSSFGVEWFVA